MNITTKFKPNEEVILVYGSSIIKTEVKHMYISIGNDEKVNVSYTVKHGDLSVSESNLFANKEELIEHIKTTKLVESYT